jgi:hypothetical protein
MTDAEREITAAVRRIAAGQSTGTLVGNLGSRQTPNGDGRSSGRTAQPGASGTDRNPARKTPVAVSGNRGWVDYFIQARTVLGRPAPRLALTATAIAISAASVFAVVSHHYPITTKPAAVLMKLIYEVAW